MSAGRVYQLPGSRSCLGCVAAMITGETLQDVADFAGHDGQRTPYRMLVIAQYLASRGFLLGAYAYRPRTWKRRLRAQWRRSCSALLIVASKTGKGTHAVYWAGGKVLDPEPTNQGKQLRDYTVLEWWPVIQVEG